MWDSLCFAPDGVGYAWNAASPAASESLLIAGGPTTFSHVRYSLVVCDGDVDLIDPDEIDHSIIVASGTIRMGIWPSFEDSCLAAARIRIAGSPDFHRSILLSGEEPGFTPKRWVATERASIAAKIDGPPLGVRFFAPADVGLEVTAAAGVVTIAGVAKDSVAARHDLRVGDIVLEVDDKPVASAEAFRRRLRTAYVNDSAVLDIRRGRETTTRVVYFFGEPTP